MRRVGALVVVALLGTVTSAAAGPAGKAAFSPAMGAVVPTQGTRTDVGIRCSGPSRAGCTGSVKVLRGSASLGSGSFKIPAGGTSTVTLKLKSAVTGSVTLALSAGGKVTRRPSTLAGGTIYRGGISPQSVKILHPSRGQGTGTVKIFHWVWSIKGQHYLVLGAWKCPGDAPWIEGGKTGSFGRTGKLQAKASAGVGYFSFRSPQTRKIGPRQYMTGWTGGTFWSNSVWAPSNVDRGTFDLTATCTDLADDGAYVKPRNSVGWLFPWAVG